MDHLRHEINRNWFTAHAHTKKEAPTEALTLNTVDVGVEEVVTRPLEDFHRVKTTFIKDSRNGLFLNLQETA